MKEVSSIWASQRINNLVQVLAVDRRETHPAVVHLPREALVPKAPIAEDAAVADTEHKVTNET